MTEPLSGSRQSIEEGYPVLPSFLSWCVLHGWQVNWGPDSKCCPKAGPSIPIQERESDG